MTVPFEPRQRAGCAQTILLTVATSIILWALAISLAVSR